LLAFAVEATTAFCCVGGIPVFGKYFAIPASTFLCIPDAGLLRSFCKSAPATPAIKGYFGSEKLLVLSLQL
jgi:hypothetical protein